MTEQGISSVKNPGHFRGTAKHIFSTPGIQNRLQHLVDIGVETIWLSPIYQSPMVDFGYDISDFIAVDPIFGTMADFQLMAAEAHALGETVTQPFASFPLITKMLFQA